MRRLIGGWASVLAHLSFLLLGTGLVLLDAWDDLKYQLGKAMR
jgi:hypothetical protein